MSKFIQLKKFRSQASYLIILTVLITILSLSTTVYWIQYANENYGHNWAGEFLPLYFSNFALHLLFLLISAIPLIKNPFDYPKFSILLFIGAFFDSVFQGLFIFTEYWWISPNQTLIRIFFALYFILSIGYILFLIKSKKDKKLMVQPYFEELITAQINSYQSINFNKEGKEFIVKIKPIISPIFDKKNIKIWWSEENSFLIITNVVNYFAKKANLDEKIKFDDVSFDLKLKPYNLKQLILYLHDNLICKVYLSPDNQYIFFDPSVREQYASLPIQNLVQPFSISNNNINSANLQNNPFMKSKITAGLFAILMGDFGAHQFYLGNTSKGLLMLLFCWTGIPGLIGLIEGIIILGASDQEFLDKFVIPYSNTKISQPPQNIMNKLSQPVVNSNISNTTTIRSPILSGAHNNPNLEANISNVSSFCPKCGKPLEGWFEFCPKCGSKLPIS
ncbi:NINE protein [Promethearchaeum syntrophicum]|uniref:NINE protein n=1 Tax=Promethearchaeum syntrophicum TaxID=2594042 RepID=A0A5B9DBW2_9ARCH|nr:NINE protein [Candidatus Prometheoarchaeum syntrophicum]QEE16634.1 TM2 domain protein [Candidatus Prometheoarchaeum syntrophicum]